VARHLAGCTEQLNDRRRSVRDAVIGPASVPGPDMSVRAGVPGGPAASPKMFDAALLLRRIVHHQKSRQHIIATVHSILACHSQFSKGHRTGIVVGPVTFALLAPTLPTTALCDGRNSQPTWKVQRTSTMPVVMTMASI